MYLVKGNKGIELELIEGQIRIRKFLNNNLISTKFIEFIFIDEFVNKCNSLGFK